MAGPLPCLPLHPIPLTSPPPAESITHAGRIISNLFGVPQPRPSLPRLLKLCAAAAALSPGRQLHALSFKLRLSSDPYVQTALLSLYSACSLPTLALHLFDRMPHRTLVAHTAAAHACLRANRPNSALSIFLHMLNSGTMPDSFSFVTALSACADIGALDIGRMTHALITVSVQVHPSPFLSTALIHMYCKCGNVDDAVTIFKSTVREDRSVEMWNAMLHGLAMHGMGTEAVGLFDEMVGDARVRPNEVTFVALLCGCAHAGLVEEGRMYFDAMREYRMEPTVKHYGCMVDLLGRAGLLDDAFDLVMSMDVKANRMVWGALLSACGVHGDVGMAERVMERIMLLGEDGDTSHYVIMSNIYRRAGRMNEDMARMRGMVGRKPKGKSWIEIGGLVGEFGVGADASSHQNWAEIKHMLNAVDAKVGVEMRADVDLQNPHSEKLALAFGLIKSQGHAPIRISKNLRICVNCHDWMKLVSRVYEREIIVRDCNRFHRFIVGLCSCKDYW